tara:strand:+ start:39 stop:254 length:216 start_codon:yes stop_codon:yes gene_type:complete
MSINKKGFIRKTLEKKEVSDVPQDGDKQTKGGIEYVRKAGKWKKVVSKGAKYRVAKAKKTPGKIVTRTNTA